MQYIKYSTLSQNNGMPTTVQIIAIGKLLSCTNTCFMEVIHVYFSTINWVNYISYIIYPIKLYINQLEYLPVNSCTKKKFKPVTLICRGFIMRSAQKNTMTLFINSKIVVFPGSMEV